MERIGGCRYCDCDDCCCDAAFLAVAAMDGSVFLRVEEGACAGDILGELMLAERTCWCDLLLLPPAAAILK